MSTSPTAQAAGTAAVEQALVCRAVSFDRLPRQAWDRLLALTPAATPFARWTVHRAWWDAYGATAHDQYLVAVAPGTAPGTEQEPDAIRGVVPLMHRHELEPQDLATATILRRHSKPVPATEVRPDAKGIFFGSAYHTDYATALVAPADTAALAGAVVESLAGPPDPNHGRQAWDVIDLRRLRSSDHLLAALEAAFRQRAAESGWRVHREIEDVCPVVEAPDADWDGYLATLDKTARHEIRRKLRRAEETGPLHLRLVAPTADDIDRFVALHQRRFGAEGLFPPTEGGRRSRTFVDRLAQLESNEPDGGQLRLAEVSCGGRLVFAALVFDDGSTCFLYNAGMDPDASELSPGVIGTAVYLRDRLANGRRCFDFLRGDEPYKYEWGARDQTIERLLVTREPST